MGKLIGAFLLLFIVCSENVFSKCKNDSNRLPISSLEKICAGQAYDRATCKKGDVCLCYENIDLRACKVLDIMEDDTDSEVFSKSETEICIDQDDCEAKNLIKECVDEDENVVMSSAFDEIYCTKFLRYNQKPSGKKYLSKDSDKAAQIESDKQSEVSANKAERNQVRAIKAILKDDPSISADVKKVLKYLLKRE